MMNESLLCLRVRVIPVRLVTVWFVAVFDVGQIATARTRGLLDGALSACASGEIGNSRETQDAIVDEAVLLLPGAMNVQREPKDYDGALRYELKEPFPATNALAELERRLSANGWSRLDQDLFNPAGGTALRFWAVAEINDRTLFTWFGYWQDKEHNVLSGAFDYVAVRKGKELIPTGNADVEFRRFSRSTAEAVRRSIKP